MDPTPERHCLKAPCQNQNKPFKAILPEGTYLSTSKKTGVGMNHVNRAFFSGKFIRKIEDGECFRRKRVVELSQNKGEWNNSWGTSLKARKNPCPEGSCRSWLKASYKVV